MVLVTEKPLETISRRNDGGELVFLRAKNYDLLQGKNRCVYDALAKFQIVGMIPGPNHTLFQVAPGNYEDFRWYTEFFLQPNVRLLTHDLRDQVVLQTWRDYDAKTSLLFKFPLTPDAHAYLVHTVEKKLGVSGG